jgi:hypothetical protein
MLAVWVFRCLPFSSNARRDPAKQCANEHMFVAGGGKRRILRAPLVNNEEKEGCAPFRRAFTRCVCAAKLLAALLTKES